MPSEDAVIYGLDYPSRALAAVVGETEKICFLVGTQALRAENVIHHLDFDEETNELKRSIYKHTPGEIWQIACSPHDRLIFSSTYTKLRGIADGGKPISNCCSIWRLPTDAFDSSSHERALEHVTDILVKGNNEQPLDIVELRWSPNASASESVLCSGGASLNVVDVQRNTCSLSVDVVDSKSVAIATKLTTSRWDPHHNAHCVAAAVDTHIKIWDTRSPSKACYAIENAHAHLVRDLDFNPNRAYVLVSGGDDGRMRVWDVRHSTRPLASQSDHHHWIFAVRYNHFHDQLVLAASSDRRVSLTNLYALSSEVPAELAAGQTETVASTTLVDESQSRASDADAANGTLVCMYEEHEDSVYAAEWASEPWCFASLSFDGRLSIDRVPKAEKYRILL